MILEVDNITLSYGSKTTLSGIYLNAKEGEVTRVLGRNGYFKLIHTKEDLVKEGYLTSNSQ
ncbi:MAG: hypothetical protein ABJX94_02240 [Flavobacteriaceae bacterium]|uniref:hypothetical protein n=1 Tax=Maribacter dokdonensis TaxID=320912 RepID=UPI003278144B